ncbi:MAG: 23S rRNA (adenine(2503)-C(2))-methyltransferase RlmN, partial [Candidatus Omnitrophota bacterium]
MDFTLDDLGGIAAGCGEPRYRARQIFSGLYRKGARDI